MLNDDILHAIGRTPLIALRNCSPKPGVRLFARPGVRLLRVILLIRVLYLRVLVQMDQEVLRARVSKQTEAGPGDRPGEPAEHVGEAL